MSSSKYKMKKIRSLLLKDLKSSSDNHVVSQTVRPSGIKLSVVSGRIEREESDVIINSISTTLNAAHGILTSAVCSRAGPSIEAALHEHRSNVHYGDVIRTSGFKLKAKAVYHVVLAGFNFPDAGNVLENLMIRCFDLAELDKWTTISIPALGTGRHAFPPFVVSHRILEAIRRYEEKYGKKARIRKIRFVLTEDRNISAFQTALKELPIASQRNVADKVKSMKKSSFKKAVTPSEVRSGVWEDSDMFEKKSGPPAPPSPYSSQERGARSDSPPPPPPAGTYNSQRGSARRPSTINTSVSDRIVKALQKSKTYKKEHITNQLRIHYRELPRPRSTMEWRYIITTKKHTSSHDDLDLLVDTLVGPEAHKKRKSVLLHGHSYVGKSTFVHHITRRWAEGDLNHIRLLILVNLQTLISLSNTGRPLTLMGCVLHCLSLAGIDADAAVDMLAPSREKFLLVLDDIEAWARHFSSELPLHTFFSKAHVIATSRSSTAVRLADSYSPMVTVELHGFCPELMQRYLSRKCREYESNHRVFEAAQKLHEFSTAEKNRNMLHAPGWLEFALEVLSHPLGAESDVESFLRYGPLMQEYIERNLEGGGSVQSETVAKFGESVLKFLSHRQEGLHRIPSELEIVLKGSSPRWIYDYCIAMFLKGELERKGKVHYLNAVDLEGVYLIQTSLEITCGFSAGTSEYIHRMIAQTARGDDQVQEARQHLLDENDQVSARVLKRLHDLQEGCLRQSNTKLIDDADVPEELQYLGAEYSRVYLMACEQGTKEVRHTRVMIVGHFGAGKTSLKRCLVKEKFNPEYNVTNGIEADPAACRIEVDSTCDWNLIERAMKTAKANEHSREVARHLYIFLKRMKTTQLPVAEEEEDDVRTPDWDPSTAVSNFEDFARLNSVPDRDQISFDEIDGPPLHLTQADKLEVSSINSGASSASSDGNQHPRLGHSQSMYMLMEAMDQAGVSDPDDAVRSLPLPVIEALKNMIHRDSDEADSRNSEVKLSFWDFAGQQVFYTTHQTFLSHRAIYILVLDLTKALDYSIKTYRQGRHGKVVDKACPQTVGEYLDYWLNSIHTHAVKDPQQDCAAQPPVLIVCTHKDVLEEKYGKEEADRMTRAYFKSIQQFIDRKAYAEHVHSSFFAVANCREGDQVISDLRRAIVSVASEQPYWGEKIPLKWLDLRSKLSELQELDGSVVTLKKVTELASDAGIVNTDEVKTLLLFYHALGELVFFDEEGLRDLIILNPQWLIDNFRKVITVSKFHTQDKFPNSKLHWSNLDTYGVLHDQVLQSVWDKHTKEELVAIMMKFNLIVQVADDYHPGGDFHEVNGEKYLVPCMLPQVSEDDLPAPSKSDPSPLLLIFQEGFVPVGLFHRLLATCSNHLKWEIFGTVYHNFASFFIDATEEVEISLRARRACIEISARLMDGDDPDADGIYSKVLPSCINAITSQLYTLIRTVSPTQRFYIGIQCSCKSPTLEGAHINLEKVNLENLKKRIRCPTHRSVFVAKGIQLWFKLMEPPEIKVEEMSIGIGLHNPPDPNKDILPTEKQLAALSCNIGFEWEKLALLLDLTSSQIQRIKMDNPHTVKTCITEVLILWRREALNMPGHQRIDTLAKALLRCDRRDLAETVARWQVAGKNLELDD